MTGLLPILVVLLASLSLALLGCQQTTQVTATSRKVDPRFETSWQETPVRLPQESVCVAQGPSPLLHLFDTGGPIRVVDLTEHRQMLATKVIDRTLVRVDDRNGVTIGSDNVVPGPLVAGHQYGIYADPQTDNIIRSGLGPPGNSPSQSGK